MSAAGLLGPNLVSVGKSPADIYAIFPASWLALVMDKIWVIYAVLLLNLQTTLLHTLVTSQSPSSSSSGASESAFIGRPARMHISMGGVHATIFRPRNIWLGCESEGPFIYSRQDSVEVE